MTLGVLLPKSKPIIVVIVYGPPNQANFITTLNENFAKLDRTNDRVFTGPGNSRSPGNFLKFLSVLDYILE